MNYGAPTQNMLHRPNEKYKGIKEITPLWQKGDLHSGHSYLITTFSAERFFHRAENCARNPGSHGDVSKENCPERNSFASQKKNLNFLIFICTKNVSTQFAGPAVLHCARDKTCAKQFFEKIFNSHFHSIKLSC